MWADGQKANPTICGGMTTSWQWSEPLRRWLLLFECDCGIAHTVDMTDSPGVLVDCVCGRAVMSILEAVPNVA